MLSQYSLDSLPIAVVFALLVLAAALVYEAGYRLGHWHQARTPDEKEGPSAMLTGSLLALFAFLLAVTMGMASDRFEARRVLVVKEANSIGTTYLRAGYLPTPYDTGIRDLLREYAPLRVNVPDDAEYQANYRAAQAIQGRLWSMTEELARAHPDWDVIGGFIATLNETIDVSNERLVAGVYARVPETIVWVLVGVGALSLGMVGYSAGLTRKRATPGAVVLILVMATVLTLIVDLDRPRSGFLTVSQAPLIDLVQQLGPPGP
jgi:hypothetical protein